MRRWAIVVAYVLCEYMRDVVCIPLLDSNLTPYSKVESVVNKNRE
jgi:hypothetical protein